MENNIKKGLKPEQKQQLKKYAVFAMMFLVFGGSMWLIFKPDKNDKVNSGGLGLNTELPMPQESKMIPDKISAFEQENLFQKEPVRSLESFSSLVGKDEAAKIDLSFTEDKTEANSAKHSYSGSKQPKRAIQRSATAYKGINQTLGNFYEEPKANPEDEKLRTEIEDLKAQLAETQKTNSVDEQLLLMEKSYQLAAKYMPESSKRSPVEIPRPKISLPAEKKNNTVSLEPVKTVSDKTVSALVQCISDSVFIKQVSQPRNYSFITADGEQKQKDRNTIWACVNSNQKLINGQNVKLRLLEPVETGGIVFPLNSVVTGIAQLQGERLHIIINSLEHEGNIIPVQLVAYDTDGQQGLFIPGSTDVNAVKEITAAMGRDAGTSINISQGTTAGQQLAADVGRSFIQGTSQFVSKKIRSSKVSLKAGHRLLLMANNQN
jgi:conjugative transposon TraM protein